MAFAVSKFASAAKCSFNKKSHAEPECCDGSDELAGVCINVCEVFGAEYAKIKAAENKTRKTVRLPIIIFGQHLFKM